jgi:tetratricopeptide (TPR) repeat protein
LHAILWIKGHWKSVLEAVALVLIVAVVVFGASNYWNTRSGLAAEELYKASLAAGDAGKEIEMLLKVAGDYTRTSAGKQAMMRLGDLYMGKGEYASAIEQFKNLAGRSRNNPMLYIAALHKLAEAQFKSGDFAGAAETYLKAAADPHNLISQQSRFMAAQCYESAGKYNDALGLYRQIIDESKAGDEAMKAKSEERIIWLAADGHANG